MIVSNNLLPAIIRVMKGAPSQYLTPVKPLLPYRWNPSRQEFEILSIFPLWWWKLVGIIYLTAIILQLAFGKIIQTPVAFWEDVLRFSLILLQMGIYGMSCIYHTFYSRNVCYFFNNLVQFDNHYISSSQQYKWRANGSKVMLLISYLMYASGVAINTMIPFVSVMFPKSPFSYWASLYILHTDYCPSVLLSFRVHELCCNNPCVHAQLLLLAICN